MIFDSTGISSEKTYFGFLERGSPDFAKAVIQRYDQGQQDLSSHPLNTRIQRAHALYYARDPNTGEQDTTELRQAGSEGEIVFADVNEFRALVAQQRVNATATPPNWAPLATNSDSSVLTATRIARAVLEHYRQSFSLEQHMSSLVETCLVMGAGWIGAIWNPRGGDEVGVSDDDKTVLYSGEFEFSIKSPYDVVVDPHSADYNRPRWMIVRRKVNRYDLAAQYPEHQDQIMKRAMWLSDAFENLASGLATDELYDDKGDVCHVLEVYFSKSPSLPAGRQALIINENTVAYDLYGTVIDDETGEELLLGLDYEEIPYLRITQSETLMERFPHADSHDLLMPVEMYQSAVGKIATLQTAKSNVLAMPKGAGWTEMQVAGQRVLEYNIGEKPDVLKLFGADENDFNYATFCRDMAQRQAVVSDAQRGISGRGDSGSKAAFVASASQTFAAGFERVVTRVWERLGTHVIRTLASHASDERVIALVGIENKAEVLRFRGQDLEAVSRVQVHQNNPALDSPQGRVETAFNLYQMSDGQMDLQKFMQIARTGQIDLMDEDQFDEDMLVKREGELMKTGRAAEVYCSKWHRHSTHIKAHIRDLYDIDPLQQPDIYRTIESHIQEHMQFLSPAGEGFDPYALLVTGEQAFPELGPDGNPLPNAPGLQPGGPAAPGGPPGPSQPGNRPSIPDQRGAGAAATAGPPPVQMPSPPINPGTGGPANMPETNNSLPAQAQM